MEAKNREKTLFSNDEKISILGEQNIGIHGFLGGFVL